MASIAGIKGISYAPYRGGWKLRWRELHETESGVVRKAQSYTAGVIHRPVMEYSSALCRTTSAARS